MTSRTAVPEQASRSSSSAPARPDQPDVVIDDTTEVRWFFDGPLPPDVLRWFTRGGSIGLRQDRCDSYRVDGVVGTGVKWRFGSRLELKLRLGRPEPFTVGPDCDGRIERWRRWSPADDLVDLDGDTQWEDVDKSIIKRRFDADGRDVPLTEQNRALEGNGCDAEVVAVRIGDRSAWSVALAAFGSDVDHGDLLHAAWRGLVGDDELPRSLRIADGDPVGYPEWLARVGAAGRWSAAGRLAG